jgi:hypothetical protein
MLLFALACTTSEDSATESQYNATDNSVEIVVGSVEVLEPVTAWVTSSTGEIQLGNFTVNPGGGPIGTVHRIEVEIVEEYAEPVSRASVRTSSGARGEDEYDLSQDSVGIGFWVMELQSVGDVDEIRTDTLTLRLWTEQ